MLYLTCTTITSVDLAHYEVSRANNWVSVDCGTRLFCINNRCKTSFDNTVNHLHSAVTNFADVCG